MNCWFITDLVVKLSCKYDSLGGNGGGGERSHARFRANLNRLRANYYEDSLRLIKEYLSSFDGEFYISLVKE